MRDPFLFRHAAALLIVSRDAELRFVPGVARDSKNNLVR